MPPQGIGDIVAAREPLPLTPTSVGADIPAERWLVTSWAGNYETAIAREAMGPNLALIARGQRRVAQAADKHL